MFLIPTFCDSNLHIPSLVGILFGECYVYALSNLLQCFQRAVLDCCTYGSFAVRYVSAFTSVFACAVVFCFNVVLFMAIRPLDFCFVIVVHDTCAVINSWLVSSCITIFLFIVFAILRSLLVVMYNLFFSLLFLNKVYLNAGANNSIRYHCDIKRSNEFSLCISIMFCIIYSRLNISSCQQLCSCWLFSFYVVSRIFCMSNAKSQDMQMIFPI